MKTIESMRVEFLTAYNHGITQGLSYEQIYKILDKILTKWGKELCEEQKMIVKSQGLILDAPLPDILTK